MTDNALGTLSVRHIFPSELGWMAVVWKADRLCRLTFGHPSAAAAEAAIEAELGPQISEAGEIPAWVAELAGRLQAFAAGESVSFADVPLDLAHLSEFQAKVVRACRKIGRGRVRSYGELAAAAGSPGASRAVGSTMARNRFPIIVPCHRVVASGGMLGGFTARDGVNMKQRMLALEGVTLKSRRTVAGRQPTPTGC